MWSWQPQVMQGVLILCGVAAGDALMILCGVAAGDALTYLLQQPTLHVYVCGCCGHGRCSVWDGWVLQQGLSLKYSTRGY